MCEKEKNEKKLTLEKFEEATEAVSRVITETKLVYSEHFSNMTGNKVYFKPENMQYTGAYKVRGAYYKISTLSEEEKKKGLITASAGNHAQGVAYAAKLAGIKATIVMPTSTPLMKVNRTRSYGAEVVLEGDVFDEALAHAYKLADEHGYTFVHPFNDLDVATGQGTIAMEIIKELPTVDYILVPIGGGGLCTGVSTLAKLLVHYYDVTGGSIRVGGQDIREMSVEALNDQISYVAQEQFLFNTSLLENIRLGRPGATDEEVLAAARAAQCEEFLARLDRGWDTPAGEAGRQLSGGERQRIAIARAIVKDAPIIVLDEATAFSDPENEYLIQKAFEKLIQNKTVVMIAHRLSTIRNADQILVMEKGCLIESGTHDELLKKNGKYAQMWSSYTESINWKIGTGKAV